MDVKYSYVSRQDVGGQHTNGPDYGLLKCTHILTGTSVEIDTYLTRGQHKARELGLICLSLILEELKVKE